MSRQPCTCKNAGDICDACDALISRAEENRIFGGEYGYSRDLDDRADAAAADDFYGRDR